MSVDEKARAKAYREKNRERLNKRQAEYFHAHRDEINAKARARYVCFSDRIKALKVENDELKAENQKLKRDQQTDKADPSPAQTPSA